MTGRIAPQSALSVLVGRAIEEHRQTCGLTPPPTPYVPSKMAASALDVFVLTFNCGKAVVDANVFARHLRSALSYDVEIPAVVNDARGEEARTTKYTRTVLPDLVVL